MLRDLEKRLHGAEAHWGECCVFLEVNTEATSGARTRQLDLVITFSNRVANCELKGFRNARAFLGQYDKNYEQIERQSKRIRAVVKSAGLDPDGVWSFWLATFLPHDDLLKVARRKDQDGFRHFTLSGYATKSPNFERIDPKPDGSRKGAFIDSYFPDAVLQALGTLQPKRLTELTYSDCLRAEFERACICRDSHLLEFDSFGATHEYLSRNIAAESLIQRPEYVPGLRNEQLAAGLSALTGTKLLVVSGPPNAGKTEFTVELLSEFIPVVRGEIIALEPVVIRNARSVHDVLAALAEQIDIHEVGSGISQTESRLFDRLSRCDVVFWIRDYDLASIEAISDVHDMLFRLARRGRAYWILESVEARHQTREGSDVRVWIGALDTNSIKKILDRRKPGDPRLQRQAVIEASEGLAGRAALYWDRGRPQTVVERLDHHAFYYRSLSTEEQEVALAASFILAEAPLGCTEHLVERWCEAVLRPRDKDRQREIVRNVLRNAEAQCFVRFDAVGSKSASDQSAENGLYPSVTKLREQLIPQSVLDARIIKLRIIDPHFVESLASRLDQATVETWQARLRGYCAEQPLIAGSLTSVSLHLLAGDILPFIRSGFRSSSAYLPMLQGWLSRSSPRSRNFIPEEDRAYFSHWLSWTLDHYWDVAATQSRWKMRLPQESVAQQALFDAARARGDFYRFGDDCDWDAWAKASAEFRHRGEIDLWADSELRRAQALAISHGGGVKECWRVMSTVLEAERELSRSNGLEDLHYHILSFFNKVSVWRNELPNLLTTAQQVVPRFALGMIESGYVYENINSIANGMFFFTRSLELSAVSLTEDDIDKYSTIMRFVQRTSPSRRVQACLTEGSLHRHYWQTNKLTWDEFNEHADEAIALYHSAFIEASKALMPTNTANALTYAVEVLIRSLDYHKIKSHRDWFRAGLRDELARFEKAFFEGELSLKLKSAETITDQLRSGMQFSYAFLLWMNGVEFGDVQLNRLRGALSLAYSSFRKTITVSQSWRRPVIARNVLSNLHRALIYVSSFATGRESISLVADLIERFAALAEQLTTRPEKKRNELIKLAGEIRRYIDNKSSF